MQADARGINRVGDILACGFGTSALMWGLGYICRLPYVNAPSWLVLILLLVALAFGGYACGRFSPRGVVGGLWTGIVSALLNLLILGSLLGGAEPNSVMRSALWWIPASLLLSALIGAAGALAARGSGRPVPPGINWISGFARVGAAVTLLLLLAGGLVTSENAGLAVVDWPNSFGYSMFLYPLSRMTGGIFFEHSHRLLGSLVGLTILVLALMVQASAVAARVKALAWGAFGLVVLQGILGGLRVTGMFTLSTDPNVTQPSLLLAVVHGVTGQIVFAVVIALSVLVSSCYRLAEPQPARTATADHGLTRWLLVVLLGQIILGALLRHFNWGLHLHITVACIVLLLAVFAGIRAWGIYNAWPMLSRKGMGVLHLALTQLALGFGAWVVTGLAKAHLQPPLYEVLIATAHQTIGALLLAWVVVYLLWVHRLLLSEPAASSAKLPAGTA